MHIDPANIQALGIGVAAILSTIFFVFVFFGARNEKIGRAVLYMVAATVFWSWFGFLYHTTEVIELARQFRVLSVIGIVWLTMGLLRFSSLYLAEKKPLTHWIRMSRGLALFFSFFLSAVLVLDLLNFRLVVGDLTGSPDVVLAPQAGPLMAALIAFYCAAGLLSAVFFTLRIRIESGAERRQSLILAGAMVLYLILGGMRFTPWYGFDFYPVLGGLGAPVFAFSWFYAIRKFKLMNMQVALAQIVIFIIWTITFARILLDSSLKTAIPDIGLFAAVFVLGIFLLRSVMVELKSQRELAQLLIDREKSEFITIAAHQLRTPVSALRWSFNLLQESNSNLTEQQKSIVERGNGAAVNMAHIIGELLDMGSIADGKFHYTFAAGDLSETIRTSASIFQDIAEHKNVAFDIRVEGDFSGIIYDASKISLVIQNLIDNAIKYTPSGGSVVVEAKRAGDQVYVSVSDSGIGFSKDDKSRIFEKFFRSDRAMRVSPDGSGLGLVISKTIVEAHGGTLTLSSEENQGSVFTILLPARGPGTVAIS